MTTIYGQSDDLIEFDGDVSGEVGYHGGDEDDPGDMVFCSDGTVLRVVYGKECGAIWSLTLVNRGSLFDRIEQCTDEDATPYSDIAHFRDGLKRAWVAEHVRPAA